jgi:hypothetical protein
MKRVVVARALALGLLMASPASAGAFVQYCDWDPLVLVVTPSGHAVLVYDSVWTSSLLNLGLPLESHTVARAYDSAGRPVTAVDMTVYVPSLLWGFSTMDEVTTGLLGSGKVLARTYGTSGQTVRLKFIIPEP